MSAATDDNEQFPGHPVPNLLGWYPAAGEDELFGPTIESDHVGNTLSIWEREEEGN